MRPTSTQMRREIDEIPAAIDRLLTQGADRIAQTAKQVRDVNPHMLISVARGSSDHAASFLKYASELLLGLPMASVGPSVHSIYGAHLKAQNALSISVSQSGQSPDIVQLTEALKSAGCYTISITNDDQAPLANMTDTTLPIFAGAELSVAATKTFVTSLVTGLWLIASIKNDTDLINALNTLPEKLAKAANCDWSAAVDAICGPSLFTLGRGPSWAISNEAALKFKETCQIHAESYSAAEVLHGPVSIVSADFPVIVFASADAAETSLAAAADGLAQKGAKAFATTSKVDNATCLEHIRTDHWMTDPISSIVSFYSMVDQVAARRGINPDQPRHLNKVTQTL